MGGMKRNAAILATAAPAFLAIFGIGWLCLEAQSEGRYTHWFAYGVFLPMFLISCAAFLWVQRRFVK